MERSIIWELKDIKNGLLDISGSSSGSQRLLSEISEIKGRLRRLLDDGGNIEYHSALSNVLNNHLSNAENALLQGDRGEFKKLLVGQAIRELSRVINRLEEKYPGKIGFRVQ